ncbi:hypothetical protein A8W25_01245 [Streptomyces sp. ERV7]|uniref:FMN-binding negative transcriptional regulator n=1 Tax=Streptomyces sp. ERV7 TaxID=1322334 RepID=UPI0007F4A0E7|nr:FMN-binding negative transcriptional regulator [Streptomyces sp. ERV7]OAR26945.1 hypothetical protein A8W25_01245 [Streptomyces sp. ERV7]
MFVPPVYRQRDPRQLADVVRRYPLAALVTNGEPTPYTTHLPVIPESEVDEPDLVGTTLLGHMNRANPHWSSLGVVTPAKLVFWGPHSYVTPVAYETEPAAPTWNFVSVHLEGVLRRIEGVENTLAVVRRTASLFESSFGAGWDSEGSLDYFRQIVPGVGAFRLEVSSAQGMFKLSQDKDLATQRRIAERFATAETSHARELGQSMDELREPADHDA